MLPLNPLVQTKQSSDAIVQTKQAEAPAAAQLQLDVFFCDHAVLKRNTVIPVSGYGAPESVVEVTLGNVKARSVSAPDGRFTVNLPPMPAMQGQQLTVVNGKNTIHCENVAVGEVYLIAGQSNMEFKLARCIPGAETASDGDFAALRYFKIPPKSFYGRQRTLYGKWQRISRSDAAKISGCGFFFGRAVAQESGVPVGLVDASLGGINIESWVSRETLLAHPAYKELLLEYEKTVSLHGTDTGGKLPVFNDKLAAGLKKLFPIPPDDRKYEAGWAEEKFGDGDWETMLLPDSWTEAGHNHAGVFWFRRTVELPSNWSGRDLELHLGAIDKSDKVYFNGELVGGMGNPCVWDYWATLRVYTIPAHLVKTGRNQIAVQAGSMASICTDGGLIGPANEMYLKRKDQDDRIELSGVWRYRETCDAGTAGMTFMYTLGPGAAESLHMLYDNMILPLEGIPFSGVLWYQGEANAICTAQYYEALLRGMLADWRRVFGDPELPFFIIQLPEYHNPHYFAPFNQWALIREAQARVAAGDPFADCIVTLGYGDTVELHAPNKKAVGEAAACCAVARLNDVVPPTGPVLHSVKQRGKALELVFGGDILPAEGTEFSGFVLAGADGEAFAAQAKVTAKDRVLVSSPEVPAPVYVWYAWGGNPRAANFCGANGLKASPFRAALKGTPSARNLIP